MYKENILKLKNMVLVKFEKDTMVIYLAINTINIKSLTETIYLKGHSARKWGTIIIAFIISCFISIDKIYIQISGLAFINRDNKRNCTHWKNLFST